MTGTAGELLGAFDAPPESRPDIARTLAALVALHDTGKFAWAFQAKVPDRLPPVFATRAKPGPYRHDLGGALLYDADCFFRTLLDAGLTDRSDATAQSAKQRIPGPSALAAGTRSP